MVTAILPSLTDGTEPAEQGPEDPRKPSHHARNSVVLSLESELTITPERWQQRRTGSGTLSVEERETRETSTQTAQETRKPSALAGYVGLFTGLGALVALILFLPLPAQFGKIPGVTLGEAVSYSFYVVGTVSLLVAIFVFFGLNNLRGEEGKGWRVLLGLKDKAAPEALRNEESASGSSPKKVISLSIEPSNLF